MSIKGIGEGNPYEQIIIQQERGKGEASVNGSTSSRDDVTVSQDARLLSEAYKAASGDNDERQARVEALKALVQNGQYQTDSQDIARNLVRDELDIYG